MPEYNYSVLTIDDEPIILDTIETYLSNNGFIVTCASSGQEGINLFNQNHYDLVLTDLYMPNVDGFKVLETIVNKSKDTPVIIVSGAGGLDDSIEAIRLGAWDYVVKPIDFPILIHQILKTMERVNLKKENKQYRKNLEQLVKHRTAQLHNRTTELEDANLQLQQAAELWETTFNSIPDLISVHDTNHLVVSVNKSFGEFLGKSPEDIIGSKCCEMLHNTTSPWHECPHVKMMESGVTETAEVDDPTIGIPLQITVSPLTHDGEIVGSVHIAKDIREQRRLEEERQKTKNLEAIANLAGGLAHDFNNLLAALVGYIDLAKMKTDPKSRTFEMLGNAKMVSKLATDLTRQLITFSKGGSPILKEVSIPSFITDCLENIPFDRSSIIAELNLAGNLWGIKGDKDQLKIVFKNIFFNSVESMPDGGAIKIVGENIEAEQKNTQTNSTKSILLSVEDTGNGIKKENLKRIFDPYFTTKAMSSEKGKGLGLAICYSIIKKHHGNITIHSEAGKGTKVIITLPAA